jgi:hypothetical protein
MWSVPLVIIGFISALTGDPVNIVIGVFCMFLGLEELRTGSF